MRGLRPGHKRRKPRGTRPGFPRCLLFCLLLLLPGGCGPDPDRPNVLLIVWDTTRADRMSLYGYAKPTTPFLDRWATEEALVFEDCSSTANATIPAHGSLFTGRYPNEHGATIRFNWLDDGFHTLAEQLNQSGYDTFLFSANPHISAEENFTQGFATAAHPWDEAYAEQTERILREKSDPRDIERHLPKRVQKQRKIHLRYKATGALAGETLLDWLGKRQGKEPFFAYLNYMEAHQPYIPSREKRDLFMSPEQVERFLKIDFSKRTLWEHSFRLGGYTPDEIELIGLAYDACVAELDGLLEELIGSLDSAGLLENTIVVVTSDHGEQLGEHHMLGHQYSLFEELLRVPLVLRAPGRVAPGRDDRPVVNFDLYHTLLELTGNKPEKTPGGPVSLLDADAQRVRVAECPADFDWPIEMIGKIHRNWDPTPFRRRLTAARAGDLKLILASDGTRHLYDLENDPAESRDIAADRPDALESMASELQRMLNRCSPFDYEDAVPPSMPADQRERLEALGYLGGRAPEH